MKANTDFVIIGAGLAGLCCARHLQRAGADFQLLEASDAVGGRVRTDIVDGFRLDRGFQILLTAYPEARDLLDYDRLTLHPFYPGALVRFDGRFYRLADPTRHPLDALAGAITPIGSMMDKIRVLKIRKRVCAGSMSDLFSRRETTTLDALLHDGFSSAMIERFFRPFLGGIFLDKDLATSSRMYEFVLRMLSLGDNVLPARGMGSISEQLAEPLAADSLELKARVWAIEPGSVVLDDGSRVKCQAIIVATAGIEAARLLQGRIGAPASCAQTCLYYAMNKSPIDQPILVLDGEDTGPVSNLAVPSLVASSYAPAGSHLVAAVIIGNPTIDDAAIDLSVRAQMTRWFGHEVTSWRLLKIYRIPHALPSQRLLSIDPPRLPVKLASGLYLCGDHLEHGSIQGAMVSGRRAADAALADHAVVP